MATCSNAGLSLLLLLLPALHPAAATPTEVLPADFADPSIIRDPTTNTWYAFATAGNGADVQVANASSPAGPWDLLDGGVVDLLPGGMGSWAVDTGIWAPDVRYLAAAGSSSSSSEEGEESEGKFVMYYAGLYANDTRFHCVGAATASGVLGPYNAVDEPLACPVDQGGAIDPSGYWDESSGTMYLLYKVDGNSIGNGGLCNNGVDPIQATPIMLQELGADGTTPVGSATELLDRGDADGPLVEAPSLIRAGGGGGGGDDTYVLFFSSSCYSTTLYDVSYATSSSLAGPYAKSTSPLLVTGDYGLQAPGGATCLAGGEDDGDAQVMVFHADCDQGRCMYETSYSVSDGIVTIT